MTAKELIAKLQELPEDINIVMSGYEGGFNDIKGNFKEVEVALNYNTEWYYGAHEEDPEDEWYPRHPNHEHCEAIKIF